MGIFVGQPLDTIRIRMQQASSQRCSMLQAMSQLIKREGLMSPYKGMAYPLAFSAVQVRPECMWPDQLQAHSLDPESGSFHA